MTLWDWLGPLVAATLAAALWGWLGSADRRQQSLWATIKA